MSFSGLIQKKSKRHAQFVTMSFPRINLYLYLQEVKQEKKSSPEYLFKILGILKISQRGLNQKGKREKKILEISKMQTPDSGYILKLF
jgi:hypothetical protein